MNATLGTADGRAVLLRMERRFAHQPEKVWRALTRPEELSQWYPFRAEELDLRVGGRIRFDDGQGGTLEAVITELDPPRVSPSPGRRQGARARGRQPAPLRAAARR